MYLPAQILGTGYDVNISITKQTSLVFSFIILHVDSGLRMIKKSRCAKCATKGLGAETTTSQGNIEVNPSYLRVKEVESWEEREGDT